MIPGRPERARDTEIEVQRATNQRVGKTTAPLRIMLLAILLVACTGPKPPSPPTQPSAQGNASPPSGCIAMPTPTGGDDTARINAWIASLPSGGCGYMTPREDGSSTAYRVDGTVEISNRSGLRLLLDGAVFRASGVVGDIDPGPKTGWRSHVAIRDSTDISLSGLRVEGSWDCTFDSSYEGEAAFFVEDSRKIVLDNVSAGGIAGDGVEIAGAQGLRITGSSFDCTGRMGVSVIRTSSDIVVTRSTFDHIARSAFDVELTAAWYDVEDVSISHNTVANHGLLFFAGGGLGRKGGIILSDNTSTVKPIRIKYVGSDLTLRGNRGTGQADTAIVQATGGSGLFLLDNLQQFRLGSYKNPSPPAVELQDWCAAEASGNDFAGAVALFEGSPNIGCAWQGGRTIQSQVTSSSDKGK
jgi:hypothetical protein